MPSFVRPVKAFTSGPLRPVTSPHMTTCTLPSEPGMTAKPRCVYSKALAVRRSGSPSLVTTSLTSIPTRICPTETFGSITIGGLAPIPDWELSEQLIQQKVLANVMAQSATISRRGLILLEYLNQALIQDKRIEKNILTC